MTAGQALSFLLFAVVAAGTPGPSNLILKSTAARVGVLRGLPSLRGQVIGMGLMLFLVAVLLSCFSWRALGARYQLFLRTDGAARLFNVAMGVLLAGSVLLFIW